MGVLYIPLTVTLYKILGKDVSYIISRFKRIKPYTVRKKANADTDKENKAER